MKIGIYLVLISLLGCTQTNKQAIVGKWNVVDVAVMDAEKFPAKAEQIRKAKVTGVHKYTFYDFMADGRYDLSIAGDTVGGRWTLEDSKTLHLKSKFGEMRWTINELSQEELQLQQQAEGGMIYTMRKINGWQ